MNLEYALLMIHGVENQILCRDAMTKELKLAVVRSLGNDAVDMALRIE